MLQVRSVEMECGRTTCFTFRSPDHSQLSPDGVGQTVELVTRTRRTAAATGNDVIQQNVELGLKTKEWDGLNPSDFHWIAAEAFQNKTA